MHVSRIGCYVTRASVSEWQQSSVGVFCGEQDHVILIKGTIIPHAKSPSTFKLYWLIHSYVHGYRWITEFRDRWNLPWTADQPALSQVDPEKRTLKMDGHEETVYFNLLQPLVGAALLSFFGVVLDCLESELSWINRNANRKMNCLLITSIQLSNLYMYHLAPSLGKWRFLLGAFEENIRENGNFSLWRVPQYWITEGKRAT